MDRGPIDLLGMPSAIVYISILSTSSPLDTRSMRHRLEICLCFMACTVTSTVPASAQSSLRQLSDALRTKWLAERAQAESLAAVRHHPVRIDRKDGTSIELQRFDRGIPRLYRTYNLTSARTISTNKVWAGKEIF